MLSAHSLAAKLKYNCFVRPDMYSIVLKISQHKRASVNWAATFINRQLSPRSYLRQLPEGIPENFVAVQFPYICNQMPACITAPRKTICDNGRCGNFPAAPIFFIQTACCPQIPDGLSPGKMFCSIFFYNLYQIVTKLIFSTNADFQLRHAGNHMGGHIIARDMNEGHS